METKEKEKYYYITRFWGDGGPYSEIMTKRETRILDADVSRDLYFMYAQINPATIELLEEYKDLIKNPKILQVLDEIEYRLEEDGKDSYYWKICERLEDDEDADRQRITATSIIMHMHNMAKQIFNSKFPSDK